MDVVVDEDVEEEDAAERGSLAVDDISLFHSVLTLVVRSFASVRWKMCVCVCVW